MRIVTPGERHSDAIIRKFTAERLAIPETDVEAEFDKTAAADCDCGCKCASEDCDCSCKCAGHKSASDTQDLLNKIAEGACPQCGSSMQRSGSMERCACGYAQASAKTAGSAKDKGVAEYYKKIFPDDYAKQLSADSEVTPPAGKKVQYGSKPVDSKVSMRVTAAELLGGECNVPDAHPESGASAGGGDEKTPDPKWQKGDSANSVSGPEKSSDHGVGGSPKDAGDVEAPNLQKGAVSAEGESVDLSDGANSVTGPEKAKSHGAGTKEPGKISAPDVMNANRMISREVVAKWCPECAQEMARRGIKAVRASVIAKSIAAKAEEQGFRPSKR